MKSSAAAADDEQGGTPPPPHDDMDAHGLVGDAVDSALAAHALMGSAHHAAATATAAAPSHADGGYEQHHARTYSYGPAPTGHAPPPPPPQPYRYHGDYQAYDSASGGYGYGHPPPPPPHYHHHGHHGGFGGPSRSQQATTAYDYYDKPYPSPPKYHYQGASYECDVPPGGHHGYGPPPTPGPPPHAYHRGHPLPPPTATPGDGARGSDPSGGYDAYSHNYTSQQQYHQRHLHSSAYAMHATMGSSAEYGSVPRYGSPHDRDSSAPAAMGGTTAHAEDFRQVTPRTSEMDDEASASTANTSARSVGAVGVQQKEGGDEGRRAGEGDQSSLSPSTTTYPTSRAAAASNVAVAKTPAANKSGNSRGRKEDKSPEEMSAAEALITTAQRRYPPSHPGIYSQYMYYPHGGGPPPPPPHGLYHPFPPPPPPGALATAAGVGVGASSPMQPPQTFPSHRDLPSPSAVATAVVAASKEIAAGDETVGTGDGTTPTTTPARKRAKGEEDVVGVLLEMKTSSAEKKAQQQEQLPAQTAMSQGNTGPSSEPAEPISTIDPKEWARLLPLRLSTPKDSLHLNRLHCFVRSTLLELFVMPVGKSIDSNLQGQQYQLGEIRHHSVALAPHCARPPPANSNSTNRYPHLPFPPGVYPHGPPPHGPLPPPPPHMMAPAAALTQVKARTGAGSDDAPTVSPHANPTTAPTPGPPAPDAAIRPAPGSTSTIAKPPAPSTFLRVGFRCVFCAMTQRQQAERAARHGGRAPPLRGIAPMGTFYPKNVSDIYNLASRFQRIHLKECRYVPPTIRKQIDDIKKNDKSRGRKDYWAKSAKTIGLVDDEKGRGIRFIPPNAFQQKDPATMPSTSTGPSSSSSAAAAAAAGSGATQRKALPPYMGTTNTTGTSSMSQGRSSAATEPAAMKAAATDGDDNGVCVA